MRVHLRNVVDTAINHGLLSGYTKFIQLPKKQQLDPNVFVTLMKKTMWESLDVVIDFNEDDESNESASAPPSIGFAVSNTTLIAEEDE